MGYEITYDRSNEEVAQAKALADIKAFWGTKLYNKLAKILANDHGRTSEFMVYFGISMNGVSGYTAQVFVEKYWTRQQVLDL